MPTPPISRKRALNTVQLIVDALDQGCYLEAPEETGQKSAIEQVSKQVGIAHSSIRRHIERANELYGITVESVRRGRPTEAELEDLGDGLKTLTSHAPRNAEYIAKSRKSWIRVVPVKPEPFGVAIVGDMHADNKGTDLDALKRDLDLLAASGVRAINIGDTLDNFHYTGKLASKAAQNRMSDKEGLEVARWIIRDSGVRWIAHILGNHDAWAGLPYAHLFQEWARANQSRFYDWIVNVQFVWDGGQYSLLAAHDFKGHSIHNPMHGLFRRAKDDGTADGYVAGHRHNYADGSFENAFRGKRYDFARVGSYKKWDSYAHRGGFDQQLEGASAMFVVDPTAETLGGRCRVLPSIEEGLEFLKMKRRNGGFD